MKTTPWFTGDVKPVRVGLYQRQGTSRGCYLYSYWNGAYWCCMATDLSHAQELGRMNVQSMFKSLKWRGLTEPTEKK